MFRNLEMGMASKFCKGLLHIFEVGLFVWVFLFLFVCFFLFLLCSMSMSPLICKTRKGMFSDTKSFHFHLCCILRNGEFFVLKYIFLGMATI